MADKISFIEAARLAGVHLNTLRNWQKAGRLKTSEKVLENGRDIWIVDLAEIERLTSQQVKKKANNTGDNNVADKMFSTNLPPDTPGSVLSPAEQSLALIRESLVKPLVDDLARARSEVRELSEEVGALKEKIRQLEQQSQASGPGRPVERPAPAPDQGAPVELVEQKKPRKRWWQF